MSDTPSPSLAAIDEAIAASRSEARLALLRGLRAVVAAEVGLTRSLLAELATLANEHGDGPPPSEEWEFLGHDGPRSTWRRYLVGGGDGPYTAAYVSREIDNHLGRVRWHWYIVRDSPGESPRFTTLTEGHADYAREGMRAADATLTPGGPDAR